MPVVARSPQGRFPKYSALSILLELIPVCHCSGRRSAGLPFVTVAARGLDRTKEVLMVLLGESQ